MESLRGVRSDALVLFGVTGDLAYKKIFPALQAMARRGNLTFPVVGVARSGLTLEKLIERAKASVTEFGGFDEKAFATLASQFRFVEGDYNDAATFRRLKEALQGAQHPTHYLASPPSMFPTVIEQLDAVGACGRVLQPALPGVLGVRPQPRLVPRLSRPAGRPARDDLRQLPQRSHPAGDR